MPKPKYERVTDFKVGDQVELIVPVKDVTWANPIPAGVTGTLTKLVRMQEAFITEGEIIEVWSVALDTGVPWNPEDPGSACRFNLGVSHNQIKKTNFGFKN